jgi:hypothetical protein
MPIYQLSRALVSLHLSVIGVVFLCTGCVGPMACGPMGCGGPHVAGHSGCGSQCGDSCNGCGERYYDEWINHPPSCCDPCDSCGNYQGQTCHACRPILSGFKSIWGYRCDPPPVGCPHAGCDNLGCHGGCEPACGMESCDGGCASCGGGPMMGGTSEVYLEPPSFDGPVHMQSHSAHSHQPQLVRGTPAVKPFQPQRTRQIFQPRDPASAGRPRAKQY